MCPRNCKIKKAIGGDVESRDEMLAKYGQKLLEEGISAVLTGATSTLFGAFMAGFDMGSGIGQRMSEIIQTAVSNNMCCDCATPDLGGSTGAKALKTEVPIPNGTSYMVTGGICRGTIACHKGNDGKYYVRFTEGIIFHKYVWQPCNQGFMPNK